MSSNLPSDSHFSDEATPQDSVKDLAPESGFGLHDGAWSEEQWFELIRSLVGFGIATWREFAALILGHLNPSQTGTSLASSEGFKRRYGKGNTMRIVMEWAYSQTGRCRDCGSRLELQADHIEGKEQFDDKLDADFIENMTLRCRRCNVVRRPSHELGGQTFLTAESALMWILFVIKPRTFIDYCRLCRIYGMTMSDIRMQEAWAMAHWLSRNDPPLFGIEDDSTSLYDLIQWSSGAITRADVGATLPNGAVRVYERVPGDHSFAFVAVGEDRRKKLYSYPLHWIAFSTYDLGDLPPYALAVRYTPPDRKKGKPQRVTLHAPANMTLLSHKLVAPHEKLVLQRADDLLGRERIEAPPSTRNGKLLSKLFQHLEFILEVEAVSRP
jgi:hypothetical protein